MKSPAATSWQALFRRALSDPRSLLETLELTPADCGIDPRPAFAMRVPAAYRAAMNRADPDDPLLRQVLPLQIENQAAPGFCADPTGDLDARKVPGLLHKYQGRALIITTTVCAIHCRYCFRRHYPYREVPDDWQAQVLAHIAADSDLHEIILSGGDPLVLGNAKLAGWFDALAGIPHLRRLRVHSRVPVVLPQRIDDGLLEIFQRSPLPVTLVVHANHPRELSAPVREALVRLHRAGTWLFNQAVLLRGVNDNAEVLRELSEALGECRVVPYYLHLLDPVQGAAHFAVPENTAQALLAELRAVLPGYLVPKLVREVAGTAYKQPL